MANKEAVALGVVGGANFAFVARVPFGDGGSLPGVVLPENGDVATG